VNDISGDRWKPAYRRIADEMTRRIEAGAYQPEQRLPGETQVCAEFGVSRITVKKALEILVDRGFIIRLVGRGTFVSRRGRRPVVLRALGSLEDLIAEGEESLLEVLSREELPASPEVAEELQVAVGASVLRIEGRRSRERPFKYQIAYVAPSVATRLDPAMDLSHSSIIAVIEAKLGIALGEADQRIDAALPTRRIARLLSISPRTPVLVTRRTYYAKTGEPLEYGVSYYSSRDFTYELRLMRSRV
jgi:GntR family transcriptional regulator